MVGAGSSGPQLLRSDSCRAAKHGGGGEGEGAGATNRVRVGSVGVEAKTRGGAGLWLPRHCSGFLRWVLPVHAVVNLYMFVSPCLSFHWSSRIRLRLLFTHGLPPFDERFHLPDSRTLRVFLARTGHELRAEGVEDV